MQTRGGAEANRVLNPLGKRNTADLHVSRFELEAIARDIYG
jgi:hypothetical protein